jgi:co-chaperonin GroES (HSP10)
MSTRFMMKMKNNYVMIQEITEEDHVSPSGIILSSTRADRNRRAVVVNAGTSTELEEGDIVLKNLGKGTTMNLNGEDYEIINESQLIAGIKKITTDAET